MGNIKCEFCGFDAVKHDTDNTRITCSCCGDYLYYWGQHYDDVQQNSKIATFLFYNKKEDVIFHICKTDSDKKDPEGHVRYVSCSEIENWYPKKFNEKIDKFLLMLADKSNYIGQNVKLHASKENTNSFCPAYFTTQYIEHHEEQVKQLGLFMRDQGYIKGANNVPYLTPKGWQRVDELQKTSSENSKTVFVAMSFADDMIEVKEKIKSAIIDCGYIPMVINEKEYNRQIVPEILYEIRQSKFVVAELTNHNNGAYYEAGYAFALGKEVIHLCKDESFEQDAHFDVKQVNTIRWKTPEDLEQKLIKRIKATIS